MQSRLWGDEDPEVTFFLLPDGTLVFLHLCSELMYAVGHREEGISITTFHHFYVLSMWYCSPKRFRWFEDFVEVVGTQVLVYQSRCFLDVRGRPQGNKCWHRITTWLPASDVVIAYSVLWDLKMCNACCRSKILLNPARYANLEEVIAIGPVDGIKYL